MVEHIALAFALPYKHPQTYLLRTWASATDQPYVANIQRLIWTEQLDASIFCTSRLSTLQGLLTVMQTWKIRTNARSHLLSIPFSRSIAIMYLNSDKVISYMKSQGFPNPSDKLIVLLLILPIPSRSDTGRFSFSIYVHYCTPFHENFKQEISIFRKIYFQEGQSRMDRQISFI